MLKLLRNKGIQKKIYIGLAVVVVATFVLSGVLVTEGDDKALSSLAKFEDRKINVQEYLDSYRAVQRQAGFMYGDKFNEMRDRINFKGEAWDRLLLLEYAKKHGLRASDSEVVGWITKQEGFQKDGKFDDSFYKMYVERALRTTARQFEEEIRQMLTIGKVFEELKKGLDLSDEKLKEAYIRERTEKDIVYGILTSESVQSEVAVNEEELQKLQESLKEILTSPESKEPLTPEAAKEEVRKKFIEGEAAKLALKKMTDLKAKVKTPADLETVFKEAQIEPVTQEKYKKGMYPAGIWPSENLQKAVESLQENGISEPFDVPKGAMIVKVTKVHPFDDKKFEEEKKTFREQAESRKGQEQMDKMLTEYRDKLKLNLELMKEIFPADAS